MPLFVPSVTLLIRECTVEEMEQRPHANQSPATYPKRFNHALSQELVELGLAKTGRIACLRYRTSRTLLKRNNRLRRNCVLSQIRSPVSWSLTPRRHSRFSRPPQVPHELRLAAILRWEDRGR
jgi:hypothetical protein